MATKINYHISMPILWRHPKYRTYYAQWQEDGKTQRRALYLPGQHRATKDKRIANRLLRNFRRDLIAGKIKPISDGFKVSFFQFCTEFLRHIDSTCESSTYILYDVALKKAKSCWGEIPLNHITSRHIDSLIVDMVKAGLAVPTINKNYRHVKAALKQAYEWEYIKVPIKFPKPLKEKKQVRYLPIEDLRKLMGVITDPEFYDFCLFSGYTGLRSGEIIRLKWQDIDNPKGFIRITPHQKNKDESRIPINSTVRTIVCRCHKRGGQKVFRFNTRSWISQKFKFYLRKAGLEKYRFHDLRHHADSRIMPTSFG